LSLANIVNGVLNNDGGDTNNRVVVPGSNDHSMMLSRISRRGQGQMPPLDSTVTDANAINLIASWITNSLPNYQSFASWQVTHFGSTNTPNAAADADPDNDRASNSLEYLVGTNPAQSGDAWDIGALRSVSTVEITFDQIANRGFEVQWADDLSSPVLWRTLDTPANRPFISATNFTATVSDSLSNSPARYYRVRVFEP
jgi:hypothetical protein